MCVGVMGTALASPLYPLYQDLWQLKASDITVIFTIYMFGVLASLLFLSRLTNRFGFLPILRAGLVVVTLGVLLSMVAWSPESFMLSRLAIGLASGMITTSASVGMSQLNKAGDLKRAAVITTFAMTLGFGLGPLVGGLIAQWAPKPLFSAYIPSLLLGIIAIYALFSIKIPHLHPSIADTQSRKRRLTQWLPRITMPPRALSRPFWIGSMGAFSAFGMFSLYASLAPSFMQDILAWHGPAASGVSIAAILFLSSTFQLAARRVPNKTSAVAGYAGLVLSNLLLIATTYTGSIWLFMLSAFTTALGHGLANLSGMSLVNKVATPASRAGLLSSYMIVGYLGTIVPILGMGWLTDLLGLAYAIMIFCAVMTAVTAFLTWGAHTTQPVPTPGN